MPESNKNAKTAQKWATEMLAVFLIVIFLQHIREFFTAYYNDKDEVYLDILYGGKLIMAIYNINNRNVISKDKTYQNPIEIFSFYALSLQEISEDVSKG